MAETVLSGLPQHNWGWLKLERLSGCQDCHSPGAAWQMLSCLVSPQHWECLIQAVQF